MGDRLLDALVEGPINTLNALSTTAFLFFGLIVLEATFFTTGWSFFPFSPSQLPAMRRVGCSVLGSEMIVTVLSHTRVWFRGGFPDE